MKSDLVGQKVKLCYSQPDGEHRSTSGIIRATNNSFHCVVELIDMEKGAFKVRHIEHLEVEEVEELYSTRDNYSFPESWDSIDIASFHDTVVQALDHKKTLENAELVNYYNLLPEHIKSDYQLHGGNDTVTREAAYVFFQDIIGVKT